jgi:hypothetical protein
LNNAIIKEYPNAAQNDYSSFSWTINYTNGRKHTLCALPSKRKMSAIRNSLANGKKNPAERKKV